MPDTEPNETRTERLYTYCRPSEAALIDQAAKDDDRTVSDWLRLLALRTIQDAAEAG